MSCWIYIGEDHLERNCPIKQKVVSLEEQDVVKIGMVQVVGTSQYQRRDSIAVVKMATIFKGEQYFCGATCGDMRNIEA